MKWIKLGKAPTPVSTDQLESYEYLPDQESVDKKFEIKRPGGRRGDQPDMNMKQSHLWAAYSFDKYIKPEQQRDYEIFCGGFLIYHENIIKLKQIKYQIYFEWSLHRDKVPFSVSIYITPAPRKEERKLLKQGASEAGTSNPGSGGTGKATIESAVAGVQADADVNDLVSVDPPPPPPPPPPPRD